MAESDDSFLSYVLTGYERAGTTVEQGLLLAISGGADSVALLHATLQLFPQQHDCIVVAHVNHSLRGADSDVDEDFVCDLAAAAGVRFEPCRVEQGSLQSFARTSLEEAARKVRYAALLDAANRYSCAAVVTAHHMDDQAETILHNIIRGTGLRGLRGMQRSRPLSDAVRLVRPMLDARRAEVEAWLSAQQLSYRTDESNSELNFTRNRVRQQVLPLLKNEFNSAVDRNLVSLARQAQQAVDLMDSLAQKILSETLLEQQPSICRLNRSKLAEWPVDVVRHVMSMLWVQQAWPRQKLTFLHYARLAELVCSGEAVRADFPGNIHVWCSDNLVRLSLQKSGEA